MQLAACKEKSQHGTIIQALLTALAAASDLPTTDINGPLATVHLIDLSRTLQIGGVTLQFGEGLTPLSVVVQGHPGLVEAKRQLWDMELVKTGSSLSLADARAVSISDRRMPQGAGEDIRPRDCPRFGPGLFLIMVT